MKFTPLAKRDPPFETKLIIWMADGTWCEATLEKITVNGGGKRFEFSHDGAIEQTVSNATHFLIPTPPTT